MLSPGEEERLAALAEECKQEDPRFAERLTSFMPPVAPHLVFLTLATVGSLFLTVAALGGEAYLWLLGLTSVLVVFTLDGWWASPQGRPLRERWQARQWPRRRTLKREEDEGEEESLA